MCNLLQSHFPAAVFGKVEHGIDFWHVTEKLAPAAEMLFGADHAKPEWHRWRVRLRSANSAPDEILAELRGSGLENKRRDSKRPVHEAITYFENHAERILRALALSDRWEPAMRKLHATRRAAVKVAA